MDSAEVNTHSIDNNCFLLSFNNLAMLKTLENIANLVSEEEFLEILPKAKLRRVKWVQMLNCLRQGILEGMLQELNSMWEYENMPEKLSVLENQKKKFFETDRTMWRPQLSDVKSQLKAHDIAHLQKQKKQLTALANEYEVRVDKMKKTLSAKRGYFKAHQLEINKYQKKVDDVLEKINNELKTHNGSKIMTL